MNTDVYMLSQTMDMLPAVTEPEPDHMLDNLEATVSSASPVSFYDTDLAKWPEDIAKDMREYWHNVEVKIVSIQIITLRHQ